MGADSEISRIGWVGVLYLRRREPPEKTATSVGIQEYCQIISAVEVWQLRDNVHALIVGSTKASPDSGKLRD